MPNDAKLGMVVGVGLVLVFAVVFFRKGSSASPSADIPRALTPAPRMSGGRGPASPRPVNRIGRPPGRASGGEGRPGGLCQAVVGLFVKQRAIPGHSSTRRFSRRTFV